MKVLAAIEEATAMTEMQRERYKTSFRELSAAMDFCRMTFDNISASLVMEECIPREAPRLKELSNACIAVNDAGQDVIDFFGWNYPEIHEAIYKVPFDRKTRKQRSEEAYANLRNDTDRPL